MKKIIKKSLSLSLALVMLLAVFASTSVFAQGGIEKKVESKLDGTISFINSRILGTVNVSKTIGNSELELVSGDTYKGEVSGSVEAGDLFDGAYKLYKEKFYSRRGISGYWRNIVMYGETRDTFPNATYTVKFPENVFVDKENVKAISNTSTVSKINVIAEDHSVKFTFNLGNWNDYEGFFNLVEKELDSPGHTIDIKIPYTVEVVNKEDSIGNISGEGECKLYKFGTIVIKDPIVNISSPKVEYQIINPLNK